MVNVRARPAVPGVTQDGGPARCPAGEGETAGRLPCGAGAAPQPATPSSAAPASAAASAIPRIRSPFRADPAPPRSPAPPRRPLGRPDPRTGSPRPITRQYPGGQTSLTRSQRVLTGFFLVFTFRPAAMTRAARQAARHDPARLAREHEGAA